MRTTIQADGENNMNTATLLKTWRTVRSFLSVPRTEKEYNHLVALLDSLVDCNGDPSLMETLGLLIAEYEKIHHPIGNAGGISVLKYLMKEHGVKQTELMEIGSQGVVSEVLSGKRDLNVRQIRNLADKFNVSPAVFIGE
jgi:HTH-type transcriptional regulator/antitoxin HigA